MVVLAVNDDQFHGNMAKRPCGFHAAEARSENDNARLCFARLVHRISLRYHVRAARLSSRPRQRRSAILHTFYPVCDPFL
jgi:hypothetical protein